MDFIKFEISLNCSLNRNIETIINRINEEKFGSTIELITREDINLFGYRTIKKTFVTKVTSNAKYREWVHGMMEMGIYDFKF